MKKTSLKKRLIYNNIYYYLMVGFSVLLILPLFFILFFIVKKGIGVLNWDFFTQLPKPVGELGGGVSNAIVGSFLLVAVASVVAIPFGVLLGVYVAENKRSKLSHWIRVAIDTLQGTPSIVIGIVAYIWIVMPLGTFSCLSGGFALGLMMIPLISKATEETVKLIPETIKEASYALGAPYYKTVLTIILPSSLPGILSGILLSLSRILGETAPLLFTAFGSPFMNANIFKSVNALPLLIFNYATSPYEDWQNLAWGASLFLISIVLCLSLIAKVIVKR